MAARTVSPRRRADTTSRRPRRNAAVRRRGVAGQGASPLRSQRAMSWREWIRTVEIEPALESRSSPILASQVEVLLRTGCRLFGIAAHDEPGGRAALVLV